jgi:hypothetical protein
MLEARGTPTVAIGLVRPQMERTRPPRGLWTPFQLGRPLGEPGDPEFQRRVLMRALGLLERRDGPVILEDFPDDPPNWSDTPGWEPPSSLAIETPSSPADWEAALKREMAALHSAWQRACARYGRTTIGLSGQAPELWPACIGQFLVGQLPTPPPSSRQIDAWFWSETIAGRLLIALRSMALQSENNALRTVGGRFFVPAQYLSVSC